MKIPRNQWRATLILAQTLTMRGHAILAIKLLRGVTGCDLDQASTAVKRLMNAPAIKRVDHRRRVYLAFCNDMLLGVYAHLLDALTRVEAYRDENASHLHPEGRYYQSSTRLYVDERRIR